MTAFKPRETLTEQVARHIENLIAFGQLRSGERIYESAMAKEMDVSHGSIREGLLLLEKRHLVKNVPRKGAFVTLLDEHFVKSLYETLNWYLTTPAANWYGSGSPKTWPGWNHCTARCRLATRTTT